MKYVILIHSNPQPWGHPTGDYLAEYQALPEHVRKRLDSGFEQAMTELQANGELVGGEALGDPAAARLYRWADGTPTRQRRPVLGGQGAPRRVLPDRRREPGHGPRRSSRSFTGPGETVELRPTMWPGGADQ